MDLGGYCSSDRSTSIFPWGSSYAPGPSDLPYDVFLNTYSKEYEFTPDTPSVFNGYEISWSGFVNSETIATLIYNVPDNGLSVCGISTTGPALNDNNHDDDIPCSEDNCVPSAGVGPNDVLGDLGVSPPIGVNPLDFPFFNLSTYPNLHWGFMRDISFVLFGAAGWIFAGTKHELGVARGESDESYKKAVKNKVWVKKRIKRNVNTRVSKNEFKRLKPLIDDHVNRPLTGIHSTPQFIYNPPPLRGRPLGEPLNQTGNRLSCLLDTPHDAESRLPYDGVGRQAPLRDSSTGVDRLRLRNRLIGMERSLDNQRSIEVQLLNLKAGYEHALGILVVLAQFLCFADLSIGINVNNNSVGKMIGQYTGLAAGQAVHDIQVGLKPDLTNRGLIQNFSIDGRRIPYSRGVSNFLIILGLFYMSWYYDAPSDSTKLLEPPESPRSL